jgi:transposase
VERKGIITMSIKELGRLPVIEKVLREELKQIEASRLLALSDRQVRRITRRVKEEGVKGLIHRSRGRPSNRRYCEELRRKVLKIYQELFNDFGPTFACEKLLEREGIRIGKETLRTWLKEERIPYQTRRKRPHRQWRERKHHFGEMVQMDGSHHAWLEDRGPQLVWMGYVDDATGTVFGRFYEYEGTLPAMDSFRRYIRKYGLPQSVYLDRHSTYQSLREPTLQEQLKNQRPETQFERALRELGVRIIHAYSPQAKGRVERSFRTFQDRLIKEMRLEGITTLQAANSFVVGYLKQHNRRFSVEAISQTDVHRPVPSIPKLNSILCMKEERVVRNDATVAFEGQFYQIRDRVQTKKVTMERWPDGKLHIRCHDRLVSFKSVPKPAKKKAAKQVQRTRRKEVTKRTSPWRNYSTRFYSRRALAKLSEEAMA